MVASWRLILLITTCLLANSCITPGLQDTVEVPIALTPLFKSCQPHNGAGVLRIFKENQLLGSGEMEWIAESDDHFRLRFSDPLGRALLTISLAQRNFEVGGPLANHVGDIEVREDGFVEYDDHFIGIKSGELPCLLNFTFPQSWLAYARSVKMHDGNASVFITDGHREITVTASGLDNPTQAMQCSSVVWSSLLGLIESKVNWCTTTTQQKFTEITGIADLRIKWINLDDD